ncbi:MAG: hypothetical protein IPM35_37260 [Myxococcales bacterium]|nr:hypothetical protein [Myxococcales bacterium]
MTRPKRQRSHSGTAWQPVQPGPSRVEPRRGYIALRDPDERQPARRVLIEEPLGMIARKLRQR